MKVEPIVMGIGDMRAEPIVMGIGEIFFPYGIASGVALILIPYVASFGGKGRTKTIKDAIFLAVLFFIYTILWGLNPVVAFVATLLYCTWRGCKRAWEEPYRTASQRNAIEWRDIFMWNPWWFTWSVIAGAIALVWGIQTIMNPGYSSVGIADTITYNGLFALSTMSMLVITGFSPKGLLFDGWGFGLRERYYGRDTIEKSKKQSGSGISNLKVSDLGEESNQRSIKSKGEEKDQEQHAQAGEESEGESEASSEATDDDGDEDEPEFVWGRPDERFSDVGGYNDVKKALVKKVINPLQTKSESYARFNIEPDRGILFYGPPGTGKTLFGKCLAGELERPFVKVDTAELTSKWINETPQQIKELLEEADRKGGVILIDEAEQVLGGRADGTGGNSHMEDQKATSTFLSKMQEDDKNFIVIATTNLKESMDEAVLRPGRLGEHFEIGEPNEAARREVIKTKIGDVPHKIGPDEIEQYARLWDGKTGAEIESEIMDAKMNAAERNALKLLPKDFETGD